jgi:hypothetical protein
MQEPLNIQPTKNVLVESENSWIFVPNKLITRAHFQKYDMTDDCIY